MSKYIVLISCVFSIAIGQMLFKQSALILKTISVPWRLLFEPVFLSAITLYGLTTLAWIWCLKEIELSRAYLFMALVYVLVPCLDGWFFGVPITLKYCLSASLILLGIVISVWV
jgi:drug/metabolite transporter (DMT)-like permease